MHLRISAASAGEEVADKIGPILAGIGGIFLVVGLGLVGVAVYTRRRRARFAAIAGQARGEVLDNVWRDVGHDGVSLLAFPRLRYTLPDGTVMEELSFEGSSPPAARQGRTVDVLYDPAQPRRVRVAGGAVATVLPVALIVIGTLAAAGGAGLLALGLVLLL